MTSRVRIVFATVAMFFATAVAFTIAEVTLRLLGYQPPLPVRPTMDTALFSPDPVLGWMNRPALHTKRKEDSSISMLVLPDRSRTTRVGGLKIEGRSAKLYVVGCSFAFGWALADRDTFAWKLQEKFPDLDVRNHGTNGYGTYQSLLLLERLLSAEAQVPASVVYAFCSFHADRNIADWRWVRDISSTAQTADAFLPYCEADSSGKLVRSRISLFRTSFPFAGFLSTAYFLEGSYLAFQGRERSAARQLVTESLIGEMKDLCSARRIRFLVAFLTYQEALGNWVPYMKDHQIKYVDCSVPPSELPRFSIVDDGHPNAELNTIWAECIGRGIGG